MASSTYLTRTPASNGSATTATMSAWVKRSATGEANMIFGGQTGSDGNNRTKFGIDSTDQMVCQLYNSSSSYDWKSTRLLRDPGAWYHLVFVFDTTNATPGDRIRFYCNGERITDFDTQDAIPEDAELKMNTTSDSIFVGARKTSSTINQWFNGCMSHVHFIDGTAYEASTFGETDSTSGIWRIKTSPSVTYGTNGFFLKLEDSSNMDLDSGTNAFTNFTTSGNLTATYDNPSNNFCTMNPLDNYGASSAFTNGNNTVAIGTNDRSNTATMGLTKGKWYFEVKYTPGSQVYSMIGIASYPVGSDNQTTQGYLTLNATGNWGYSIQGGGTSTSNYAKSSADGTAAFTSPYPVAGYSGNQIADGDIVQVAIDLDNNAIWWGKNDLGYWGTDGYNGVPNTNTNGFAIADPSTIVGGTYYVACGRSDSGGVTWTFNFGNGYFGTTAVSSTNADDAGIGSFEYDVPAGFYTICSKNLKVYG